MNICNKCEENCLPTTCVKDPVEFRCGKLAWTRCVGMCGGRRLVHKITDEEDMQHVPEYAMVCKNALVKENNDDLIQVCGMIYCNECSKLMFP